MCIHNKNTSVRENDSQPYSVLENNNGHARSFAEWICVRLLPFFVRLLLLL